jgi:hypothetical protein
MLLVRASSSDVSCRHLTVMRRGVPRSGETTATHLLRRRRVHDEIVMHIIESSDVTVCRCVLPCTPPHIAGSQLHASPDARATCAGMMASHSPTDKEWR